MKRLLALLFLLAGTAWAANTTTIGTLTLTSTFNCISVKLAFTGADDNANNSATIEYKAASSGTWLTAYTPMVDRRATIETAIGTADNSAYRNQVRGSIVSLIPDTSYNVRVTVTDPDGVSGTNPATGTVSTITTTPPAGGTTKYVSPSGNNGADGSSGTPWQTIAYAIANTSAGDTIALKTGSYAGMTISTSGTAGAYRKLIKDTGATPTISATSGDSLTISANYWIIDGLTFASCPGSAVVIGNNQHHIYVQNCTMANVGTNNAFGNGGVKLNDVDNIFILNNTMSRSSGTGNENDGVWFNTTGTHTIVVKGNTFSGNFWDYIGNGVNSYIDAMENTDFAENTMGSGNQDDPLETDGGSVNMRVWGNTVSTSTAMSCMSNSPIAGPAYIFRNTFISSNSSSSGIKGGHGGNGYVRFFHNVVRTTGGSGNEGLGEAGGTPLSENGIFRNNIFMVTGNAYNAQGRTNTYNFNCLYPTGGQLLIDNWNGTTDYSTIAAFRSGTGQEANGINANPVFVNSTTDFHLQTTSPCKNAGVTLVNFNDSTSSTPHQGAAPDMGAYEFSETDTTAPLPNPMTFSSVPAATDAFNVTMTATAATDASGSVEYYFDETTGNTGGSDSGWISTRTYTDSGLSPSTLYTYRVKARDVALNETAYSSSANATTTSPPSGSIDIETLNVTNLSVGP